MRSGMALENPEKECEVMWSLCRPQGHPNVIDLIDVYKCDSYHWQVLELCDGEFFDMISIGGALPNSRAKHYFRQLMDGVKHIHNRGFMHGDLSLENMMKGKDDSVKIIDF